MDKGRLELALKKVRQDQAKAEPLCVGHWRVAAGEDVGAGRDDSGVDEDRAKVLDEENGAPGNLGAEVLDEQLAGVRDARDVGDESLAVLDRLLGGRVEEANAVKVTNSGLLSDGLFHILDGRPRGQLDAGGKTLDGLLRRCSGEGGRRSSCVSRVLARRFEGT